MVYSGKIGLKSPYKQIQVYFPCTSPQRISQWEQTCHGPWRRSFSPGVPSTLFAPSAERGCFYATFSSMARSSADSLKSKMSMSSWKCFLERVCVENVAPWSTIHRRATWRLFQCDKHLKPNHIPASSHSKLGFGTCSYVFFTVFSPRFNVKLGLFVFSPFFSPHLSPSLAVLLSNLSTELLSSFGDASRWSSQGSPGLDQNATWKTMTTTVSTMDFFTICLLKESGRLINTGNLWKLDVGDFKLTNLPSFSSYTLQVLHQVTLLVLLQNVGFHVTLAESVALNLEIGF